MSRPIRLGINRAKLKESEDVIGSLNYVFTRQIDANPDAEKLQVYLLSANAYQPPEPPCLFGDEYKYYLAERIEQKFLPFIAGYRDCFKFSADVLGWIKNPTAEQLGELVPENWPYAMGRTFFEYFGQCKAIGSDVYYSMHTFWEGRGKLNVATDSDEVLEFYNHERYVARPTYPDETEFWLFYDHFGKNSVVLDTEMPAI